MYQKLLQEIYKRGNWAINNFKRQFKSLTSHWHPMTFWYGGQGCESHLGQYALGEQEFYHI